MHCCFLAVDAEKGKNDAVRHHDEIFVPPLFSLVLRNNKNLCRNRSSRFQMYRK